MNGTHKREIIERPRARRNAAKVLALTLQNRLRALYDAQTENDEDAIVIATGEFSASHVRKCRIRHLGTEDGCRHEPATAGSPEADFAELRGARAGQRSPIRQAAALGNRARACGRYAPEQMHLPAARSGHYRPRAAHDVLPEIRALVDLQQIAADAGVSIDEVRERWLSLRVAMWKSDFRRFAKEAVRIRTKSGDLEPLELNEAQLILHNAAEEQLADEQWVRLAGLKGRRQGFSTYVAARGYWR
jgi:hypothetical protein